MRRPNPSTSLFSHQPNQADLIQKGLRSAISVIIKPLLDNGAIEHKEAGVDELSDYDILMRQ